MERYEYTMMLIVVVIIILLIDAIRDLFKQVNKNK